MSVSNLVSVAVRRGASGGPELAPQKEPEPAPMHRVTEAPSSPAAGQQGDYALPGQALLLLALAATMVMTAGVIDLTGGSGIHRRLRAVFETLAGLCLFLLTLTVLLNGRHP